MLFLTDFSVYLQTWTCSSAYRIDRQGTKTHCYGKYLHERDMEMKPQILDLSIRWRLVISVMFHLHVFYTPFQERTAGIHCTSRLRRAPTSVLTSQQRGKVPNPARKWVPVRRSANRNLSTEQYAAECRCRTSKAIYRIKHFNFHHELFSRNKAPNFRRNACDRKLAEICRQMC
jgi:hypothetical protein